VSSCQPERLPGSGWQRFSFGLATFFASEEAILVVTNTEHFQFSVILEDLDLDVVTPKGHS
jgi:hypothetical protein